MKNCLIILVVLAFNLTFAKQSDMKQLLHINSDKGYFDNKTHYARLTNNVKVTQGTMLIKASKIEIFNTQSKNKHLIIYGEPNKDLTFKQQDNDNTWIYASGQKFDYQESTHIALLTGNAKVIKGSNTIKAQKIQYNTLTQKYYAINSTGAEIRKSTPVSIVINPSEDQK